MFICVSGVAFMLRGGLLTFGHALFYATGAYTVGFMVKYFGVQELLIVLPLGALTGFIMAALVGLIMARYREVFFAMLNLAFSMMLFGAFLVVMSSLIIFRREAKLKKQVVPPRA